MQLCGTMVMIVFKIYKLFTRYLADMFHLLFPLSDKLHTFLQAAEIVHVLCSNRKIGRCIVGVS